MENPDYVPGTICNNCAVFVDALDKLRKQFKGCKHNHPSKYIEFRKKFFNRTK